MQSVGISDPAWLMTFPYLVVPLPDEWLLGLLLRCDEANHWASGTTLALLRLPSYLREIPDPSLAVPSALDLSYLAQCLALSMGQLLATTYQLELARCYRTPHPHFKQLSNSFRYSLCPECFAHNRRLQRIFMLPHVTCCQEHHIVLLNACSCGRPLSMFSWRRQSYICNRCGLDWARLPRRPAEPKRMIFEQRVLSYYDFFFLQGTPEILEQALGLITLELAKKELEYWGKYSKRRFHPYPRSYGRRRYDTQTSYHVAEGTRSVNFHQGNVILGDLVGLLAEFDLSPFQFSTDP